MISWLLGLGLAGGAITMLILPSALRILTPVLELAAYAFAEYARGIWHGLKTANYGTWLLVITAVVIALMWSKSPCTASYGAPRAYLESGYSAPSSRGAVNTTPKIITKKGEEFNWTPKDIFCHWFGCL